jgi:CheY-like chemotaxis protein
VAKRLLFVDDDVTPNWYHVSALEQKGFEVLQCVIPDRAVEEAGAGCPYLIVLDIMMPPGKLFTPKSSDNGLITGVLLYSVLRAHCPDTPVAVLTNVQNPQTLARFTPGPRLRVFHKVDWLPTAFAEEMARVAEAGGW